ncbi:FGFR1 oncogene partner 2 homolog [Orussus abietinus]|uniref:FGFR1 oncogene partner 2 homolog n=1 Tax=Orussus abietinus TaxID=222816 RepID=UPI000626484E|nr:FGFR1 oncogene partner 2 homolog [Orussus abietinus]
MSLTFQQIILDAKKLVGRISDQESTADNLITEIQSVYSKIENMRQYQDQIEILNTEAKQRPHSHLIAEIQQENRHLREIQLENKMLKNVLTDHQNVLQLVMTKYRQQASFSIRNCKTDFAALQASKYTDIIARQAEKIDEMAAVMKAAAAMDEESELKEKEELSRLREENNVLREIINVANKYGSLNMDPPRESKTVQTDLE